MNRCRSCDAPIVWARTLAGKAIPVDWETTTTSEQDAREVRFDPARHRSHFATCPHAGAWRRKDLE